MDQVEMGLEILRPPKLSKSEFKELILRRGWRMADAAFRWGVRSETISRVAGDEDRDLRWDDLVRALPQITRLQRAAATAARLHLASNSRQVAKAKINEPAEKTPPVRRRDDWDDEEELVESQADGFRYSDYVSRGSELVTMSDIGSFTAEGVTLVVVQTRLGVGANGEAQEEYLCRAPDDTEMWLTPDQMDDWVASTGKTRKVDEE